MPNDVETVEQMNREANELARIANKVCEANGIELPLEVCMNLVAMFQDRLASLSRDRVGPNRKLQEEIDLAWEMIENGWEIEPREYFEREAPKNGFRSPLAQAVHHMWKRKLKEDSAAAQGSPAPAKQEQEKD